jgi:hypothetical protein
MATIISNIGPSHLAHDDQPLPVAVQTQGAAFRYLQRLVLGEVAVLVELGVTAPPGYDVQSHEWGLGYDPQSRRWIVVRGGPGITKYVGNGLPSVFPFAHTNPTDPSLAQLAAYDLNGLDQQVGPVGLTGRTLRDVCAWLVTNDMMIDTVAGLAPLFPSNADVVANYTIGAERTDGVGRTDRRPRKLEGVSWPVAGTEIMYPTCFLDPNGWISANAQHQPLQVTFSPATAQLVLDAATNAQLRDGDLLTWVYAPVELSCQGREIWRGAIRVDPALAHAAWLLNQVPGGTVTRAEAAVATQHRA